MHRCDGHAREGIGIDDVEHGMVVTGVVQHRSPGGGHVEGYVTEKYAPFNKLHTIRNRVLRKHLEG